MKKIKRKPFYKTGLAAGSPIYVGKNPDVQFKIELFSWNNFHSNFEVFDKFIPTQQLHPEYKHWINVIGINHSEEIQEMCDYFGIDALITEDILNTFQRPKSEIFEDYMFFSLKHITNNTNDLDIEDEQISIIAKKNVIITFQEKANNFYDVILNRLKRENSRLRLWSMDYFLYAFLDVNVDNYVAVVDHVDKITESFDQLVLTSRDNDMLNKIQYTKAELLQLKKVIFPLREALVKALRSDSNFIEKRTLYYFNDVNDHLLQTTESIDYQINQLSSQRELFMANVNNRMNETIKVLTIITTIFIPLSFIAGLYGMNFDNMPELHMKYGYFIVLGVMAVLAFMMMVYFRIKKWW